MILTQRRRETKKEDESSSFSVPLPYGGVRGGFPSLMEGLGVAPFFAVLNINALLRRHSIQLPTINRVPLITCHL